MKRAVHWGWVLLAIMIAGSIAAADNLQRAADRTEICQDKQELKRTKACYDKLSSAIDNWHDAYLLGDEKRIGGAEKVLVDIIVEDINVSYKLVGESEKELVRSRVSSDGSIDQRTDVIDDRADLKQARKLLNSKEHLLAGWKKADSFGYKYRVLGDYQELLRQEMGVVRLELAEDAE